MIKSGRTNPEETSPISEVQPAEPTGDRSAEPAAEPTAESTAEPTAEPASESTAVGVPDVRPIRLMPGALYLVGTPIGNLGDLSPRAAAVMAAADRIVAEDTRRTLRLLNALGISKPLISYHEHNQGRRGPELIVRLQAGETLALVSDAGMPCISDPGEDLVRLCVENDIPVVIVPGPTAALSALATSALQTHRFAFDGFLPAEGKDRRIRLAEVAAEARTVILYEAPHRLRRTLADLAAQGLGARLISIARELTKRYETVLRLTVDEAVAFYQTNDPKGEYVLILEGLEAYRQRIPSSETVEDGGAEDRSGNAETLLCELLAHGMSVKDAAREAARKSGLKRKELYEQALRMKQDDTSG